MCQRNDKRMHRVYAKCYRVYEVHGLDGQEQSFYNYQPRPELGVWTPASNSQPFHGFRNKKDIKAWKKTISIYPSISSNDYFIYECILTSKLRSGTWDRTKIKTCTGKSLMILKKVAEKVNGKFKWLE